MKPMVGNRLGLFQTIGYEPQKLVSTTPDSDSVGTPHDACFYNLNYFAKNGKYAHLIIR